MSKKLWTCMVLGAAAAVQAQEAETWNAKFQSTYMRGGRDS